MAKHDINSEAQWYSLLLIMLFVQMGCNKDEVFVRSIQLNNKDYQEYAEADDYFHIESIIDITHPKLCSASLVGVQRIDSFYILATSFRGVFAVDKFGAIAWHIKARRLNVNHLNPLVYCTVGNSNIIVANNDRRILYSISSRGTITEEYNVSVVHHNSIITEAEEWLFETTGLFPSSERFEQSNLLTLVSSEGDEKPIRAKSNLNIEQKYSYQNTLHRQDGIINYIRPYVDTVFVWSDQIKQLEPLLTYRFVRNHPNIAEREKNGEDAYDNMQRGDAVQPNWLRYRDNKLYVNYNSGRVNHILIHDQDTTVINTSLLDFKEVCVMPPTVAANDGYFFAYYSERRHELLQRLKWQDYSPDQKWIEERKIFFPPVPEIPEKMVLVVFKS